MTDAVVRAGHVQAVGVAVAVVSVFKTFVDVFAVKTITSETGETGTGEASVVVLTCCRGMASGFVGGTFINIDTDAVSHDKAFDTVAVESTDVVNADTR